MGKKSELDSTKEGLDSGAANEKTARVDKSNKKKNLDNRLISKS